MTISMIRIVCSVCKLIMKVIRWMRKALEIKGIYLARSREEVKSHRLIYTLSVMRDFGRILKFQIKTV